MIKIFIHKINNIFQINDFQISLTDFQKLEPDIYLPQDFNEIACTDNDNDAQYIEYNGILTGIDDTLRFQLLATETKIDEYKTKLSEITYKKHSTTNEIKTFKFGESYDVEVWIDITEIEKAEYKTNLAKITKEAELEMVYNSVKNNFALTLDYNDKHYKYTDYKISDLIILCNQKKDAIRDRAQSGQDTIETSDFTQDNKFKFRINGYTILLTEEKLIEVSLILNKVVAEMYSRKKTISLEIKGLNYEQDVIDYEISFDGVETQINFNNII